MTLHINHLAAAAALALSLAPQAHADSIFAAPYEVHSIGGQAVMMTGGDGTLTYSSGIDFNGTDPNTLGALVGALNVGRIEVHGVGGVSIDRNYTNDEFDEPIRTELKARTQVSGYTVDTTTGQILGVSSAGGLEHRGTRISGTLTGGVATVSNLRFDLQNNIVYADLQGTKGPVGTRPAVNYSLPNTALWTIDSVSGPTVIDPAALALQGQARLDAFVAQGFTHTSANGYDVLSATQVISGLRATTQGFNFFRDSLGLLSTGVGALSAVYADPQGWGSFTSTLTFAIPVPEASTYAMMAAGMLVIGSALHLRRSAAAAR
ncbi:MAG: hypothetical protein EOP38_13765 [Rubrivivax sp.]|nr:MAG: hypothetical protein EOP38_13765 [Rubrivivax sp.]